MRSISLHAAAGVLADTINDASSTRKVYLLAGGLAVLGIVLIVITVWFWRSTRHDPELLAPLETMGSRRFRKMDDGSKRQLLDAVRPDVVHVLYYRHEALALLVRTLVGGRTVYGGATAP